MKIRNVIFVMLLSLFSSLCAQNINVYKPFFEEAYKRYPDIPQGILEAISNANTHCTHLTDANYFGNDPNDLPRNYGVMGLVLDGKSYFRNNLLYISGLSAISVEDIMSSPEMNIMAYAAAFSAVSEKMKVLGDRVEDYRDVIVELSELPLVEDMANDFVINSMLYSVYASLPKVDLKLLFGDNYKVLSSSLVRYNGKSFIDSDYPEAIWDPAPECNYGSRNGTEVSAVVVHYTAGSYAGAISWFKNCDSQVSSHYVIRSSDGQITQMVSEADKAWHVRSANPYTIGIEHEAYGDIVSYFTPEMYAASAKLVKNIAERYETIMPYRMFYRDTLDDGTLLNYGLHSLGDETSCIKIRGHQHYPDQSHTDPGPYWDWNYYFKLVNDTTIPVEYNDETGTFLDSGGSTGNYSNDERKLYLIRVEDADRIVLSFSAFDLEDNYDFMWIYDGDNEFAPKLGRWNTKSPGTVTSSGNAMMIEFRSDCATTAAGWIATWMADYDKPEYEFEFGEAAKFSPNPVKDNLFIIINPILDIDYILVYDAAGRLIDNIYITSKEMSINMRHYKSGLYLFAMYNQKKLIATEKVIRKEAQ